MIWFHFDCIIQFKKSYHSATNVCSRKMLLLLVLSLTGEERGEMWGCKFNEHHWNALQRLFTCAKDFVLSLDMQSEIYININNIYDYIRITKYVSLFHFKHCIKKSYHIATNVCSRKSAPTFDDLPNWWGERRNVGMLVQWAPLKCASVSIYICLRFLPFIK